MRACHSVCRSRALGHRSEFGRRDLGGRVEASRRPLEGGRHRVGVGFAAGRLLLTF